MQRRGRRASPPPPPPLPLRLLPSCPFAPGPLPGLARSPARALLAALPSLPPRRWLRALSSCQSVSPGRGPIALELLPRRLGLGCRCRRRRRSPAGPAARWLARAPARPAPPAPPSAPPAPLPPPLPLVYLELNRTWLPGRGSEAGVNVPRLMAASANRRAGAGPAAREGRPVSARPRQSPLRPPPPSRCPCSRGRAGGARGRAPLFSVDVGRGLESGWGKLWSPGPGDEGVCPALSAPGTPGGRGALRQRRRGGGADP